MATLSFRKAVLTDLSLCVEHGYFVTKGGGAGLRGQFGPAQNQSCRVWVVKLVYFTCTSCISGRGQPRRKTWGRYVSIQKLWQIFTLSWLLTQWLFSAFYVFADMPNPDNHLENFIFQKKVPAGLGKGWSHETVDYISVYTVLPVELLMFFFNFFISQSWYIINTFVEIDSKTIGNTGEFLKAANTYPYEFLKDAGNVQKLFCDCTSGFLNILIE